ncbi:MAG: hypothetical protein IJ733_03895 [Lachnospiraceae bacterium]|nr:hypothetical protein [Lachnospiraceae bacterium]
MDNGGWVKVKGSDGKVIGDESDPSVDSYSELLINGEWLGLKKESGSRYKWGSYFPYYIGNTGNKPADYYSYSGATLQVAPQREYIEGGQDITSISWPVSKTKTKNISLATDKSLTTPLTAIKTSTRDGIPAKLTVPKRPSAPAVVVDYLKGTIAIPKRSRYQFYTLDPNLGTCRAGMHFRNAEFVLYTEENTDTDSPRVFWVGEKGAAYDDKKENWLGKYDVNDKPFYVEHYQYITDKKKKFLSSKIRRTLFKGRKQTDNPDGNMLKTSDGIRTVKDITIRFACEKSGKYTIVFENASLTNQYYVRIVDQNVKKGTPPKVLDKTYKLLKAKKDSTVATLTQEVKTLIYKTNLTAKEDFEKAINQEEGKKIEIFITKIGNKKTEEWSGFASKVSFVEGGDGEFVFE